MPRLWIRYFLYILLGFFLASSLRAQTPPPAGTPPPQSPPAAAAAQTDNADTKDQTPVLQYAVAFLSTLLVMVIVCMPSRKG